MRCEIVRDVDGLAALEPEWEALWRGSAARAVNLLPSWVEAWRRSRASGDDGRLEGELMAIVCRVGGDLVGLAPLYVTPPRGPGLRARELRLLGEGVIGVRRALLAAPGEEGPVADAVAAAILDEPGWDLLELVLRRPPPMDLADALRAPDTPDAPEAADTTDPDEAGATDAERLVGRLSAGGLAVERDDHTGRPEVELGLPWERWLEEHHPPRWLRFGLDGARLRDGGTRPEARETLLRLMVGARRCEGAAPQPRVDPSLVRFLDLVLPDLLARRVARLRLLELGDRGVVAASVVLADGERRVELALADDGSEGRFGDHLGFIALHEALEDGAARYELSPGREPPFATVPARGEHLRVYNASPAGRLQRSYASLKRRATSMAEAARGPFDQLRPSSPLSPLDLLRGAAPEVVQRAVARVAVFRRLHLYRGELYARRRAETPGLELRTLDRAQYEALAPERRHELLARLELDEAYCLRKWERGDLAALALLDGRPAGIVWCARDEVPVPDIGRRVRPLSGECYIHDVFVAPEARGRAVAPAILEFLARELRSRDVYRAWALIERSNTSSTRAFEKAGYASVADVIYGRMGGASKLLLRPPDPEARAFLGLK